MDNNDKNEPGCLHQIIGFIFLTVTIILVVYACNSKDGEAAVSTSIATTAAVRYEVKVAVFYDKKLLSTNPICDIYIDDIRMAEAQAAGSGKNITVELEEGVHSIAIKTSDFGLFTGSQSNSIDFNVVNSGDQFYFSYHKTLTALELWNKNTDIVVD